MEGFTKFDPAHVIPLWDAVSHMRWFITQAEEGRLDKILEDCSYTERKFIFKTKLVDEDKLFGILPRELFDLTYYYRERCCLSLTPLGEAVVRLSNLLAACNTKELYLDSDMAGQINSIYDLKNKLILSRSRQKLEKLL